MGLGLLVKGAHNNTVDCLLSDPELCYSFASESYSEFCLDTLRLSVAWAQAGRLPQGCAFCPMDLGCKIHVVSGATLLGALTDTYQEQSLLSFSPRGLECACLPACLPLTLASHRRQRKALWVFGT